jgi:hypothetical protein
MKLRRRELKLKGITLLAAVALTGGASLVAVTPASAAGPCGSGYNYIGSYPITVPSISKDYRYGKPGTKTGSLDVYWNATARKNCALAYAYGPSYGIKMYRGIEIGLYPSAAPNDTAGGYYSYYAGPVYTATQPVGGQCIGINASFGPSTSDQYSYGRVVTGRAFC